MLSINRKSNIRIKKKRSIKRKIKVLFILIFIISCITLYFGSFNNNNMIDDRKHLSNDVLKYKPLVEKYASEYKISEYINYLLAIMQIESGGVKKDVMQSSESVDLKPNTLNEEDSIKQGCKYFSELLSLAKKKGCDIKSVIQSYNYGKGFLDYIEKKGHTYSFELAEKFAEESSKAVKVDYKNPIAIKANGGWRYKYGNMFYVDLVNEYID